MRCRPVPALVCGVLLVSAAPALAQQPGLQALRSGHYDQVIEPLQARLRQGQIELPQAKLLLRALMQVGRYDEAIEAGYAVASRSDQAAGIADRLGLALAARGRLEAAEQQFVLAAHAPVPDRLDARLNLAVLEFRTGRRRQAMVRFDSFVTLYNTATELTSEELTAVGVACTYLGIERPQLFHDAVRAFDEAIAADPANQQAPLRLGELFLAKYDSGQAADLLQQVLRANPRHARALLADARRLHFDGSAEAMDRVREALAVNPSLVPARVFMAELLLSAEQAGAAERELEQALEVDSSSLPALAMLAATKYLQDDQAGFDQVVQRALAIDPQYGDLYRVVADMAVQHRLYERAVRLARRGVELDPRCWSAYGTLGINELRVGDIEQGRADLEMAFAGDPFNVWIKNTLDLLDTFPGYRSLSTAHFELFLPRPRADLLALYMGPLAEQALTSLSKRYRIEPPDRVRVEAYDRHADFSVRTVGLAGIGALGVAFGAVIAVDAPVAAGMGEFNWASTLWHEITHVVTLAATEHRIPRWLTEGLSVFEERRARPGWGEEVEPGFLMAWLQGKLLPVSRINEGFVRPRYPQHIAHSYLQASLVCELLDSEYGFPAILAMLDGYRRGMDTPEVIEQVLGLTPDQFDARFREFIEQRYRARLDVLRPSLRDRNQGAEPEQRRPPGIDELRARVRATPEDYLAQLQLGVRLYEDRRDEEALEHLQAARDLFPEHADGSSAYVFLARLYEQRGQLEQAAAQLQRMLAYNESSYDARIKLAELYARLERLPQAAEVLQQAMYINPYEIPVHERLAEMLESLGDAAGAVRERSAVVALHPVDRARALFQLARAQVQAEQYESARRSLLGALELAPEYPQAQELLLLLRTLRGETRR